MRRSAEVDIRLLELPDCGPDGTGTLLWTGTQPADTVAAEMLRAFETVLAEHGETATGMSGAGHSPQPK